MNLTETEERTIEQPKDRYKILIEPQRGLFGLIQGENMKVALHAGHDSVEYDSDDKHRTLVLELYGEKPDEIWTIENLRVHDRSHLIAELTLVRRK